MEKKKKLQEIVIGKNPKLSELIAWAEQNGLRIELGLTTRAAELLRAADQHEQGGAYCNCAKIEHPPIDKNGICYSCHLPRPNRSVGA